MSIGTGPFEEISGKPGRPRLVVRPATEADYDFLYDLHRQAFYTYVDQTWGWDEVTQQFMFRAEYAAVPRQVVLLDGEAIGSIAIEDQGEALFLDYIAILPAFQGRGVGTALVQWLVEEAQRRLLPVRLHVLKVDPARVLYERLGFVVTGGDEHRWYMETRGEA